MQAALLTLALAQAYTLCSWSVQHCMMGALCSDCGGNIWSVAASAQGPAGAALH